MKQWPFLDCSYELSNRPCPIVIRGCSETKNKNRIVFSIHFPIKTTTITEDVSVPKSHFELILKQLYKIMVIRSRGEVVFSTTLCNSAFITVPDSINLSWLTR